MLYDSYLAAGKTYRNENKRTHMAEDEFEWQTNCSGANERNGTLETTQHCIGQ